MTLVHNEVGLKGPQIVQAFLGELSGYLAGAPDVSIDGTPQEIVESVIRETDRFANCTEQSLSNLSRQLVMALRAQGARFRLQYKCLTGGRIQVKLVLV